MRQAKVDVSVLILFFNRPDKLREVFSQVKKACPARLFLYQDGPRGSFEQDKTEACRKIVDDSEIDWTCDVQRNYQTFNSGCDPSGYLAQAWAFSHTDKLIVLEDDCVPTVSFFAFAKELLDRYEKNERVWMIAGFNAMEKVECSDSYFFTDIFSIWGWASWKRVFDTWDCHYQWMDDPEKMNKVTTVIRQKQLRKNLLPICREHKLSGVPHFETIFWTSMLLNDGVAIMPSLNQINNIGAEGDTTHFTTSLKTMPRGLRRQFLMLRYEIAFPLVHPSKIDVLKSFKEKVYRMNAWNHPWQKVVYSIEELFLNLRYFRLKAIFKAIKQRLKKSHFLLTVLLLESLSVNAQGISDLWVRMPQEMVPYLSKGEREEMVECEKIGVDTSAQNLLHGTSSIDTLTQNYGRFTLSSTRSMQLVLLEITGDSILCVIDSYKAPATQSHIHFYDLAWTELNKEIFFPEINYVELTIKPDTMDVKEYEELLSWADPVMVKMDYCLDSNEIEVSLDMPFVEDEKKISLDSILCKRKLKWNGIRFVKCY